MNEKELTDYILKTKFAPKPAQQPEAQQPVAPKPKPVVSGTPEIQVPEPVQVQAQPIPERVAKRDEIRTAQKVDVEYQQAKRDALSKAVEMVKVRFPNLGPGDTSYYDKVRAYRNVVMDQQGFDIPIEDDPPPATVAPEPMTAEEAIARQTERGDKVFTPVQYDQVPTDLPEKTARRLEKERAEMGGGPTGRVLPNGMTEEEFEERYTKARRIGEGQTVEPTPETDPFARIAVAQRGFMRRPEAEAPSLAALERLERVRQEGLETPFGTRYVSPGVDGDFFTTPGVGEVATRTFQSWTEAWGSLFRGDFSGWAVNNTAYISEAVVGMWEIMTGAEGAGSAEANRYVRESLEASQESIRRMASGKGSRDLSGFLKLDKPGLGERMAEGFMDGMREMVVTTRGTGAIVNQGVLSGLNALGIDGTKLLDPDLMIQSALDANYNQQFMGYTATDGDTVEPNGYLSDLMVEIARETPQTVFELGVALATGGSSVAASGGVRTMSQTAIKKAVKKQAALRAAGAAVTSAQEVAGRAMVDGYEYWTGVGYTPEQALAQAQVEAVSSYAVTAVTEYFAGKIILEKIPGLNKHLAHAAARIGRKAIISGVLGGVQEVAEEVLADAIISYGRDDESMLDRLAQQDPDAWYQLSLIFGVGAVMDGTVGAIAGISEPPPTQKEMLAQLGQVSLEHKQKRANDYQAAIEFVEDAEQLAENISDADLARIAASGTESALGDEVPEPVRITGSTASGVGLVNRQITPIEARIILQRRHSVSNEELNLRSLQQVEPEKAPVVRQKLGEAPAVTDARQLREDARGTLEPDIAFAGGDPLANTDLREWVLDNPELARSIAEASSPPSRSEMETLFNRKHKSNSGSNRARFWAAVQVSAKSLPEPGVTEEAQAETAQVETEAAPQDPAGTLVEIGEEQAVTVQESPKQPEPEPVVEKEVEDAPRVVPDTNLQDAENVVQAAREAEGEADPQIQRRSLEVDTSADFSRLQRRHRNEQRRAIRELNAVSEAMYPGDSDMQIDLPPEEAAEDRSLLDKIAKVVPAASRLRLVPNTPPPEVMANMPPAARQRFLSRAGVNIEGFENLTIDELHQVSSVIAAMDIEGTNVELRTEPKSEIEREASDYAKERGVTLIFLEGGHGTISGFHKLSRALVVRADESNPALIKRTLIHELVHTWQNEAKQGDVVALFKALALIAPEATERLMGQYAQSFVAAQDARIAVNPDARLNSRDIDDRMVAMETPAVVADLLLEFIMADDAVIDELLRVQPGPFMRFIQRMMEILGLASTVEKRIGKENIALLERLSKQGDADFTVEQKVKAARVIKNLMADLAQSERAIDTVDHSELSLKPKGDRRLGFADLSAPVRPMETALARYTSDVLSKRKSGKVELGEFTRTFMRNPSLATEAEWRNWDHFHQEIVAKRTAEAELRGEKVKSIRATREELEGFFKQTSPVVRQYVGADPQKVGNRGVDSVLTDLYTKGDAGDPQIWRDDPSQLAQLLAGKYKVSTIKLSDLAGTRFAQSARTRIAEVLGDDIANAEIRISTSISDPRFEIRLGSHHNDAEFAFMVEHVFEVRANETADFQPLNVVGNDNIADATAKSSMDPRLLSSIIDLDTVLITDAEGELERDHGAVLTLEDVLQASMGPGYTDPATNRDYVIKIPITSVGAGVIGMDGPESERDIVNEDPGYNAIDEGVTILSKDAYKGTEEINLDLWLKFIGAPSGSASVDSAQGSLVFLEKFLESNEDFSGRALPTSHAAHWFARHTSPASSNPRDYAEVTISTYGTGTVDRYVAENHFSGRRTQDQLASAETTLVDTQVAMQFPPEKPNHNIAGHFRYDIRTDSDGNQVMFVGEVQSDYQVDQSLYGVQPRDGDGKLAPFSPRKRVRVEYHPDGVEITNLDNGKSYYLTEEESKNIQRYVEPNAEKRTDKFDAEFGDMLVDMVYGHNEGGALPVSSNNIVADVLDQVMWVVSTDIMKGTRKEPDGILPKLPLLDVDHHERGIMDLMNKQILKIAVQKGVTHIAFTHGETLDEQWSMSLQPNPFAFEYDPDTEMLTFAYAPKVDTSDEAKLKKELSKNLRSIKRAPKKVQKGEPYADFPAPPTWGHGSANYGSLRVPNHNGIVSKAQIARAFARRNAVVGAQKGQTAPSDLEMTKIADTINKSAGKQVEELYIAESFVSATGKRLWNHSSLVEPQKKRLRQTEKHFKKNGYATRVGQSAVGHNLLESIVTGTDVPLDIYEITEDGVNAVEDSHSGAYTINFKPQPLTPDGDPYNEIAEEGQFEGSVPNTPAGRAVQQSVRRLMATDTPPSDYPATFFVGNNPEDLRDRNRFAGNLLFTATNSSNSMVREIATKLTNAEMRNRRREQDEDEADSRYYDSLPREFRKNRGAKFFELMDKVRVAPDEVDTNPKTKDLPSKVRRALAHFKARGEQMRLSILSAKREVIERSSTYGTMQDIVDQANNALPDDATPWSLQRLPRRGDPSKTRVYIIDSNGNRLLRDDGSAGSELAKLIYPDDWGYQYEHIHHAFFGAYTVGYIDEEKYHEAVTKRGMSHHQAQYFALVKQGSAKSQAEAFDKLKLMSRDTAGLSNALRDDQDRPVLVALPSVQVPSDVATRLSSKQHAILLNQLQEAGGLTSQEIFDATRGIVGTKAAKNPFYAALMQRKGAEGYETDFWAVWQLQRRGFRRYMLGQTVNRIVFPRTENLRRQGLNKWAAAFEELANYIIYPASDENVSGVERWFDSTLEAIFGGTGDRPNALFRALRTDRALGHRPLRRFAHLIRSFQYVTKLWTVRQHVVNSFQPLQTVWPLVGEMGMIRAIRLYHSREGKRILKKYGPSPTGSMYRDAPVGGVSGVRALRSLQRISRAVLNRVPYEVRSEVRNQNFAFLAMFDHAKRNLGMNDDQAAEYAMVRGVVMTQYAFTRTTQPYALRGPIAATAFQFKRFLINQVQLAYAMYHRGMSRGEADSEYATTGYGALTRFMLMQFMLGGIRGLVPLAIYEIGKAGFCKIFPEQCQRYGTPTGRDDVEEVRKWMEDTTGSRGFANTVAHGVFAGLLDIDISGSVALLDRPYGRNFAEVLGNQFLGPTGNSAIRLATDLTEKTTTPMGTGERIFKSILDTSPSLNQIRFIPDAYNAMADYMDAVQDMERSGQPYFNSQGEFQFEMTVGDAFRKMCAFRTMTETETAGAWAHQQAINALMDSTQDEIATYWAGGDLDTAQELIGLHNACYPELPIRLADCRQRMKNKRDLRRLPVVDRRLKNASRTTERYMRRKYGSTER